MENLNKLEFEILNRVSEKYPKIKSHLPLLKVKNRLATGVGMYINFVYTEELFDTLEIMNSTLSLNELIQMQGLDDGLNYEVDITDGRINFIEIVSIGDSWDGAINNFTFIPI
jgi:hypothetical protein